MQRHVVQHLPSPPSRRPPCPRAVTTCEVRLWGRGGGGGWGEKVEVQNKCFCFIRDDPSSPLPSRGHAQLKGAGSTPGWAAGAASTQSSVAKAEPRATHLGASISHTKGSQASTARGDCPQREPPSEQRAGT